jgi:triacylglycerol esterase/lipase EstA (alpha/beta hydrolase family)
MLARMLRFTMAMQMLVGAALGYWLSPGSNGPLTTLLVMVLVALGAPPFTTVLSIATTSIRSRAAEPAALWWRALFGEMRASMQIFLLRQPWTFSQPTVQPAVQPVDSGAVRIPVLLVHGFVCNCRVWDDMVVALRSQGHTVLAINLEPLFTSIDHYAPLVEQAVRTLCQQTGRDRVALLGHSMGGLAIRAWMRRCGTARAARAVTLGTPHAGTRVAFPVVPPNGTQMAWQSEWLRVLAASEDDATRSLFRTALSPQDNIVFPQRAQTLQGVTPVVFEGRGHLQMCTSPEVIQWVCTELALV